jgi:uncharacterized repeat protein (TIGR01451 family)
MVMVALAALCLALLVSAQSPPVSAEKTASPEQVPFDDFCQYTVVFSNTSDSDVDLLVISDTLPAGFKYMTMGAGSQIDDDPDGDTGTIVWQGPYTVLANDTLTMVYDVLVEAPVDPDPYDNFVEALLSTGETIFDTASVHVIGPELTGTKSASAGEVYEGDLVDYTVTLTNEGTDDAVLVAITDTLPTGFIFQQMVSGPLGNPTVQGNQLIWPGPIDLGAGNDLVFTYQVEASGAPDQVHENSVVVAFDSQVAGPYQASVLVKERIFFKYVPLVILEEEPEPPPPEYRLALETRPGDNFEIYAMNIDLTDSVNVSNLDGGDLDPRWSSDGTKIVWVHYIDNKGDIFVANADGSGRMNLTNHAAEDRAADWSPDGSKIAFRSYRDGRWEVYAMNSDGSNTTRLTDRACQSYDPLWSPDGTKIAFICGLDNYADIFVMDPDGQNQQRLTNNEIPDLAPAWSPDSAMLAFVRYEANDAEIYAVNVATGMTAQLTDNSADDFAPDWSPDGTKIAFSSFVVDNFEIMVMDADGSNAVNISQTARGDFVPKWSPDGLMIAFISNRPDGTNKNLWVMNADGSDQSQLTTTGTDEQNFDWMPH